MFVPGIASYQRTVHVYWQTVDALRECAVHAVCEVLVYALCESAVYTLCQLCCHTCAGLG